MEWDITPEGVRSRLTEFAEQSTQLDADARACVADLTEAAGSCGGLGLGGPPGSPVGDALTRFTAQTLDCLTGMRGGADGSALGATEATAAYGEGDAAMEAAALDRADIRAPMGHGPMSPHLAPYVTPPTLGFGDPSAPGSWS
ncbi:DUF6507 family protein [Streptomyces spiramenti]|uniref:Uncharacterized protein n=1 Tax=Streptomyces spiramenti TaxID=2720606 RepID=A0ABX1AHT2_9ACTN|nr:DUF6507 family protein [Streptomyces spiramenti]NJP66704.1 hypothetical protein [Streptomyces spiramenti]